MFRFFISACLVTLCLLVTSASAESFKDEEYLNFVRNEFTKMEKPDPVMFVKLRELYADTSFFDPNIPQNNIDAIVKDKTQEDLKDEAARKQLMDAVALEREKHMGEIATHIALVRFFESIGAEDLAKHSAAIANFMGVAVYESGDGLTPETAYKAINKTEQHFVLNYFLKRTYETKRLENIEGTMFDVYETVHAENGEKKDVYFDLSSQFGRGTVIRRMKELQAQQKEQENAP